MLHGMFVTKVTSPGHVAPSGDTATEQPVSESFVVRIYRINAGDACRITGFVEMLDSSGEKEPFVHIDELGAILNRRVMDGRRTP